MNDLTFRDGTLPMPPPPARPFRPTRRAASNAQWVRCLGCTAPLMELCWHTLHRLGQMSSALALLLGGRVVFPGEPTYVALCNSWIIIKVGGGPTDDKLAVTPETHAILTRSAASSIFRSKTPRPCTPNGVSRHSAPDASETAQVRDPLLRGSPAPKLGMPGFTPSGGIRSRETAGGNVCWALASGSGE